MKRLLIVIILTVFCALNCFGANYKLAPEYKTEIEQAINKEIPNVKYKVNHDFNSAYNKYFLYMNLRADKTETINIIEKHQIYLDNDLSTLFVKLVDITNNYVNIKNKMPITDYSGDIYEFIYPYLENNNVNTKEIDELTQYVVSKWEILDKMHYTVFNN